MGLPPNLAVLFFCDRIVCMNFSDLFEIYPEVNNETFSIDF